MLLPTLLYDSETLTSYEYDKSRVKTIGMDFLRCACDIRSDCVRKEVARNLCGVEKSRDESS